MGKFNPSVKKARIVPTARGYFHDLDPYKFFPTKADAIKDRARLLKLGVGLKSRSPRVPTFYTVLQDPRKNNPTKFGSVPQGPHTFPHHGIHSGIAEAKKQGQLDLLSRLIPAPSEYELRVDEEIPATHVKYPRAKVAKAIFKKRYSKYLALQKLGTARSEAQTIKYAHAINRLIQLHPYGSYAYKGKGAGKSALKGKGESSLLPLAKQIQLPANNGFVSAKRAARRNARVLKALQRLGMK